MEQGSRCSRVEVECPWLRCWCELERRARGTGGGGEAARRAASGVACSAVACHWQRERCSRYESGGRDLQVVRIRDAFLIAQTVQRCLVFLTPGFHSPLASAIMALANAFGLADVEHVALSDRWLSACLQRPAGAREAAGDIRKKKHSSANCSRPPACSKCWHIPLFVRSFLVSCVAQCRAGRMRGRVGGVGVRGNSTAQLARFCSRLGQQTTCRKSCWPMVIAREAVCVQ